MFRERRRIHVINPKLSASRATADTHAQGDESLLLTPCDRSGRVPSLFRIADLGCWPNFVVLLCFFCGRGSCWAVYGSGKADHASRTSFCCPAAPDDVRALIDVRASKPGEASKHFRLGLLCGNAPDTFVVHFLFFLPRFLLLYCYVYAVRIADAAFTLAFCFFLRFVVLHVSTVRIVYAGQDESRRRGTIQPHLTSVMAQDRRSGALQLLSQGIASSASIWKFHSDVCMQPAREASAAAAGVAASLSLRFSSYCCVECGRNLLRV